MINGVVFIILFIISVFLAVRSVDRELAVPLEIKKLKIPRKKKISGVILFLKEKIVHYSSKSASGGLSSSSSSSEFFS